MTKQKRKRKGKRNKGLYIYDVRTRGGCQNMSHVFGFYCVCPHTLRRPKCITRQ